MRWIYGTVAIVLLLGLDPAAAAEAAAAPRVLSAPGLHPQLTEPPCSYCSTENRKGVIKPDDRVIAWVRGAHNGGAIPLRHFLGQPRIINDTYGLFFHDTDGGYVSAFKKDYGFTFEGWRGGVMVARGPDGTLWSALTGRGLAGPQQGKHLERIPTFLTQWGYWLMLHPESTAYNMFDGQKYPPHDWPSEPSPQAQQNMGPTDARLAPLANVLGIEAPGAEAAYPLDSLPERACARGQLAGTPFAVFWYAPTRSAIAFDARVEGRTLTFYADDISPETAPFKDQETGTRWTLAGRAVDGPLRGRELTWMPCIQCRWYAWSAEYPETRLHTWTEAARP
jgi:hypothetical protein